MGTFAYSGSLDELGKLLDHIPISGDIPSNGRFMTGVSMDSRFPIGKESASGDSGASKDSISFRDIVRLFSRFLATSGPGKAQHGGWEIMINEQRYRQLRELGCTYPVNYLLFDFSLAALERDLADARLFLAHSLHILGLHYSLNLLLSVIINEKLTQDGEVRYLLALLGRSAEPRSAQKYLETFGPEFRKRYETYVYELKKVD